MSNNGSKAQLGERCDVLVLGAGPAGVAAARHLSKAGLSVIALEARDRVGGRTHTSDELGVGLPLDHGGKWIHGACKSNAMMKLIKGRGEERECRKETKWRNDRQDLTRLVLPMRGSDESASAEGFRAVEPSQQCLNASKAVFDKILKLAERGRGDECMSLEELLYETYADCVPAGDGMDDSCRQRLFYYNLIQKIVGDSPFSKKSEAVEGAFLDETMALLNAEICDFFEAHEGSPIHQLSAKHGMESSELPGGDLDIPFGYGELISRLAQPLVDDGTIRLGHKVVSVETSSPRKHSKSVATEVMVRCEISDGDEQVFRASSCIVALPLGVLRSGLDPSHSNGPLFRPGLPGSVSDAINNLGINVMNKLELTFDSRWWPRGLGWLDIGSSLPGRSPTYHPFSLFLVESEATPSKPEAPNVLVCYLTGEFAKRAEQWTDAEAQEECMEAIRKADFPAMEGSAGEVPDPTGVHMTRWLSDPFSKGSWTFLAKNSGLLSMKTFRKDKECQKRGLFFAGEHTCDGSRKGLDIGTVHGAWLSGEVAAKRVVGSN